MAVYVQEQVGYEATSKYMIMSNTKAKKENLEPEQIALLKALVKELERHG